MDDESPGTTLDQGRIPQADRIQRLVIGGALMLLTTSRLANQLEWQGLAALALQTELLLTGIFRWCPIYWTCRVTMQKSQKS